MFQLCDSSLVPGLIDTVGSRDFPNQGHMAENHPIYQSGLILDQPSSIEQLGGYWRISFHRPLDERERRSSRQKVVPVKPSSVFFRVTVVIRGHTARWLGCVLSWMVSHSSQTAHVLAINTMVFQEGMLLCTTQSCLWNCKGNKRFSS